VKRILRSGAAASARKRHAGPTARRIWHVAEARWQAVTPSNSAVEIGGPGLLHISQNSSNVRRSDNRSWWRA
jgi:hypothetical protein